MALYITQYNVVRSNLYTMPPYNIIIIAFDEKVKRYKIPTKMSKLCSQIGDVVSVVEKMWRQFSDEVIINFSYLKRCLFS